MANNYGKTWKIIIDGWVNPLFLWPCSIANCDVSGEHPLTISNYPTYTLFI